MTDIRVKYWSTNFEGDLIWFSTYIINYSLGTEYGKSLANKKILRLQYKSCLFFEKNIKLNYYIGTSLEKDSEQKLSWALSAFAD